MNIQLLLIAAAIIHSLIVTSALFAEHNYDAIATTPLPPLENNSGWLSNSTVVAPNTSTINTEAKVSGDDVYLVWDWGDLNFTKSSDGGNTFSSPLTLVKRIPNVGIKHSPHIEIFRDTIYIVYTTEKDVFLVKSVDSGKTFSSPINVSKMKVEKDPYAVVSNPIISVADDGLGGGIRVYVGWIIWQQMYFAQSSDGGLTFDERTNVSKQGEFVFSADIGSSDTNVYLVWSASSENDKSLYHISFASSNDGGHTFHEIENISGNKSPYDSFEPHVAVGGADAKTVYLVWRDDVPISPNTSNVDTRLAFTKSTDSGKTFDITEYIGSGDWPALSVSGQNIYIASGIQNGTVFNVGFVASLDGGNSFSKQIMLSNQTWAIGPYDEKPIPAIASDGANVFVAWRYAATGISGVHDYPNHETFLAASYDEGRTFTRQLNISASMNKHTLGPPTVAAAPMNRVFVFWPDHTVVGNTADLMFVKGQIPEEYTLPFRQSSYVTSLDPYNNSSTITAAIVGVAVGIGAAVTVLFIRRKRKVKQ